MSACLEHPGRVRLRLQVHRAAASLHESASTGLSSTVACALLLFALPVILPALIFGRLRGERRVGRMGRAFTEYVLTGRDGKLLPLIGAWPRLWSVMRGELALVGPEARGTRRLDLKREADRRIAASQPGLISSWWIRQRTNVAYTTQAAADLEYIDSRSFRTDAGIALRALLSLIYGRQGSRFAATPEILGLPLDNLTLSEAVNEILEPAEGTKQVSFINVDCVNKSCRDREYKEVLCNGSLRLADGIGLRVAGTILGSEIRQNVNGTDLFPVLCERMEQRGLSIFLLGGRPGVAEGVAGWIRSRFPELEIAGVRDGYWGAAGEEAVVEQIRETGADILLVAMGAPLQEKWIARHREGLGVRAALGVGGLFDFYSGRIERAPEWLREVGLEWTWRLIQEPGRMWRRYLVGNVVFLVRVAWSRITNKASGKAGEMVKS